MEAVLVGLERALDFFNLVGLNDVAFLDVVEVLYADAAVLAGGNFLDVVLTSLE